MPREAPVVLEDAAEAEEYEVDRVLQKRVVRGREEFLVRWKGYSSFEDSWEPRGNLQNAREALQAFESGRSRGKPSA